MAVKVRPPAVTTACDPVAAAPLGLPRAGVWTILPMPPSRFDRSGVGTGVVVVGKLSSTGDTTCPDPEAPLLPDPSLTEPSLPVSDAPAEVGEGDGDGTFSAAIAAGVVDTVVTIARPVIALMTKAVVWIFVVW